MQKPIEKVDEQRFFEISKEIYGSEPELEKKMEEAAAVSNDSEVKRVQEEAKKEGKTLLNYLKDKKMYGGILGILFAAMMSLTDIPKLTQ